MESQRHIDLVNELKSWIANEFGVDPYLINDALPSYNNCNKTPRLLGGEPDLFYESLCRKTMVIGEAKTAGDINTPHSTKQYNAFFSYCENHGGECHLILAVPYGCKAIAYNLLRRLFINAKTSKFRVVEF